MLYDTVYVLNGDVQSQKKADAVTMLVVLLRLFWKMCLPKTFVQLENEISEVFQTLFKIRRAPRKTHSLSSLC